MSTLQSLPLGAHKENWRSQFSSQNSNKQHRKGNFTKSLVGRYKEDGSFAAHKRLVDQENKQKKRLATLEEHTKNVAKLQEEALEVQAQLEDIQHRNRLKLERAERRRQRHQQFCAARTVQNFWRCCAAVQLVNNTRIYVRELAATILQRVWRYSQIARQRHRQTTQAAHTLAQWFRTMMHRKKSNQAAVQCQTIVRGLLAKRCVHRIKFQRIEEESAVLLQAVARGRAVRAAAQQQPSTTFVTAMGNDVNTIFIQSNGTTGMNSVNYHYPTDTNEMTEMTDEEGMTDEEEDPQTMQFGFSAPTTLMPKLSLKELPANGETYHEEFLNASNEFSKSWREQLEQEEGRFNAHPLRGEVLDDDEHGNATIAVDPDDDQPHACDTTRSDGGTVVETIRKLRHLKNTNTNHHHHQQRPHSSPVKRTTGMPFATTATGRTLRKTFRRPTYKSRRDAFVDEVKETRKAAAERVRALEMKRMKYIRKKVLMTAGARKKEQEDKVLREKEQQEKEKQEKKDREWRFKEGMAELRQSLKKRVEQDNAKKRKLKKAMQRKAMEDKALSDQKELEYFQKEHKRKAWIKKKSELRRIQDILHEKIARENAEKELQQKQLLEAKRKKIEQYKLEKRREAMKQKAKEERAMQEQLKKEADVKSQQRTKELQDKVQEAHSKIQERLMLKKKQDVAFVKRLKKESREKEKEMRRLKKVARQRRQMSMAQNRVPVLKTLHPDQTRRSIKKGRKRGGRKRRKNDFEDLSLLSARSSPSRMSRSNRGRAIEEDSVLMRAMRESQTRREPRSAPTSPETGHRGGRLGRDEREEERRMYMPFNQQYQSSHHHPVTDKHGADALIDVHDEQEVDVYGREEEKEEGGHGVVSALPMRRNNESVDDYIARATHILEQQAFDEM
jgi:hypothetical protein